MLDPTSMSPGSIMPAYPWLFEERVDKSKTPAMINVMRKLGVPYPMGYEKQANADLQKQAQDIATSLQKDKLPIKPDREIIALIAYLQRMGKDIKSATQPAAVTDKKAF
jgi:cytochrome c oxidase cbb3-type subunit I/II